MICFFLSWRSSKIQKGYRTPIPEYQKKQELSARVLEDLRGDAIKVVMDEGRPKVVCPSGIPVLVKAIDEAVNLLISPAWHNLIVMRAPLKEGFSRDQAAHLIQLLKP